MVNDAKDPEALAAMTLLGTRATSFQKKKEANGPPTGEELNFESLRHHSLRETSSLSPDKVLKLVTTRKEGRSAPSNAGADGLVFPTPIQHQQENSQDMPRLSIRSAADNLLEPSTGAGIKEGNNDDTMDQVLPPEIAFQSPLPKDQSKGSERDWSAPIVAAAHTLSDPPSITFKKDSIGGKGDYSEVLKTAASTPITTSQAPITPPHSLSGDPPDQTCMVSFTVKPPPLKSVTDHF